MVVRSHVGCYAVSTGEQLYRRLGKFLCLHLQGHTLLLDCWNLKTCLPCSTERLTRRNISKLNPRKSSLCIHTNATKQVKAAINLWTCISELLSCDLSLFFGVTPGTFRPRPLPFAILANLSVFHHQTAYRLWYRRRRQQTHKRNSLKFEYKLLFCISNFY